MLINDKCNEHRRDPSPARGAPCKTCNRIRLEEKIGGKIVRALLAAGYSISVHDGDTFTLSRSTDPKAVLAAMFTSDDDRLYVRPRDEPKAPHLGWVWLIYGNGGWDVVSDYTTPLEPALAPVFAWIERHET